MSIEITSCSLGYDQKEILKIDRLEINSGLINLFVGNNGEGKTTFLKSIIGLLPVLAGNITPIEPSQISYLSAENSLFDVNLLGAEYLNLIEGLNLSKTFVEVEEITLLTPILNSPVRKLSTGMKQLLRIYSLFLENKKIYIWDEPLKSLAPEIKEIVVKILTNLAKDNIVVVTDHDDQYWDKASSKILKIEKGHINELL